MSRFNDSYRDVEEEIDIKI